MFDDSVTYGMSVQIDRLFELELNIELKLKKKE